MDNPNASPILYMSEEAGAIIGNIESKKQVVHEKSVAKVAPFWPADRPPPDYIATQDAKIARLNGAVGLADERHTEVQEKKTAVRQAAKALDAAISKQNSVIVKKRRQFEDHHGEEVAERLHLRKQTQKRREAALKHGEQVKKAMTNVKEDFEPLAGTTALKMATETTTVVAAVDDVIAKTKVWKDAKSAHDNATTEFTKAKEHYRVERNYVVRTQVALFRDVGENAAADRLIVYLPRHTTRPSPPAANDASGDGAPGNDDGTATDNGNTEPAAVSDDGNSELAAAAQKA